MVYHEDPSSTDFRDDFEFLCAYESHARAANKRVHAALTKCVEKIKEIAERYPDAGIGDTATDEAIAEQFYSKLH